METNTIVFDVTGGGSGSYIQPTPGGGYIQVQPSPGGGYVQTVQSGGYIQPGQPSGYIQIQSSQSGGQFQPGQSGGYTQTVQTREYVQTVHGGSGFTQPGQGGSYVQTVQSIQPGGYVQPSQGGVFVQSGGTGGAVETGSSLSCFNCNLNLTGYRYILRDEKPFCIKCYETLFANQCAECKTAIGTDHKDLSYKDKHWHEACFKCADCRVSLVDRSFAYKNDKPFCADCHDNHFALRCDGCNNIFRAGMKKYEFKGKQYHEHCFSCKVCRQPIGTKTFIPRDQDVVCVPCYEEQYAQRCVKCQGVINKGGITYKNAPWHRECFTCCGCNRQLTGEKFTSREEKPFCAECFAQLFAKKCCRCTGPITGLGTTKFISFDNRHWHTDCFVCYKCNSSLVGRGFLVTGNEVLCPNCGRA